MRQDANNKVKFIIFSVLWCLGLSPQMGHSTAPQSAVDSSASPPAPFTAHFAAQWSDCDQALMQFHGRRSSRLSEFLKLKATQRILFSGTALLQPQNLFLIQADPSMIARANQRAEARYADRMANPRGWAKGLNTQGLGLKISFPKPNPVQATQLPELNNPTLPTLGLLDMARKIQNRSAALPLVYKTNRSVLGSGIAFVENDPTHEQSLLLKFPYSENNRAVGPFHEFPEARKFLKSFDANFRVDEIKGMAELRLDRQDPKFQQAFVDFFSYFSIDEVGFYDPGIFESKIPLIRYQQRAYESRFIMALDVATGTIYQEVTPEFLKKTGLSSAPKLLEKPYSKVGASDSVANIWGRESGGATLLAEAQMYDGLLAEFPELKNRLPEFRQQTLQMVETSVRQVGDKLRNHMPERGSIFLLFEVDVGWHRNDQDQLIPYLIESHIGPI